MAVRWLDSRLPRGWLVERSARDLAIGPESTEPVDSLIVLRDPNGTFATMAVEARQSFSPRDAVTLLPRLAQLMRSLTGNTPLLVVAPWLSNRSQTLLAEQNVNYLDTTGNALLRLDHPAFYLETAGAARNPVPPRRGRARLTGAKAGRLIRLLADVSPPYGVSQLASSAGLAPGYVSQLLETLDREALIERSSRGRVQSVDIGGLLRRWATTYDVFATNRAHTYIAAGGFEDLLERIAERGLTGRLALTGSMAASRLAPVSAPATVIAYCASPGDIAEQLGLLPADEGANVVLLQPFDPVVWERTTTVATGLQFAAPSQVAVDCLSGNGRMPTEGDALLEWMLTSESAWRLSSLDEARGPETP